MSQAPAIAPPFSLKEAVVKGVDSIKGNLGPILVLQAGAVILVWAYYTYPGVRESLKGLEAMKRQGGVPFALLVGFAAGGIIPEAAKLVTGKVRPPYDKWLKDAFFNGCVIAIVALLVYLFYEYVQAPLWGTTPDLATIVKKVALDMGVASPFCFVYFTTLAYVWKNEGFSFSRLVPHLQNQFLRRQVLQLMVPCWMVWIPILCCVYSLPQDLQFPVSQVAEAAWCLMLALLTKPTDAPSS